MSQGEAYFRNYLQQQGPITVAEYMHTAMTHPEFGYYMTRDPLGAQGDFVTAPEVSQMFGELIGIWAVHHWIELGEPQRINILELGPGRGTLMSDFMRGAKVRPAFLKAAQLQLVEVSPVLQEVQRKILWDHKPHLHNVLEDALEACGEHATLVIANEFFDALPMHQYVKTPEGWCERQVTLNAEKQLAYTVSAPLTAVDFLDQDAPDGAIREISPEAQRLFRLLCQHLKRASGAMVVADYGYNRPGFADTFQAVAAHTKLSPLRRTGLADLTAHVDFGTLKKIAKDEAQLQTLLTNQWLFLQAMGIEKRASILKGLATNEGQRQIIDDEVFRLTDESQMGTLFKVLEVKAYA